MIIKEISQVGSDVIRAVAKPVEFPLSAENAQILQDMRDTLADISLVGLAAPQIGHSVRIFLVHPKKTKFRENASGELQVFINPEIIEVSPESSPKYEGCGSVAYSQLFGTVERHEWVVARYFDENGNEKTGRFDGIEAHIIQHELDHLNGIVFVDKISDTQSYMSEGDYRRAVEAGIV